MLCFRLPVQASCAQCGGSGMFIPDPTFFHPGSRIRTVSIPDPGSLSSILTPKKAKKWFLSSINMIRVVHPGSRIQGSKRHSIPDPGSGSATLPVPVVLYRCYTVLINQEVQRYDSTEVIIEGWIWNEGARVVWQVLTAILLRYRTGTVQHRYFICYINKLYDSNTASLKRH